MSNTRFMQKKTSQLTEFKKKTTSVSFIKIVLFIIIINKKQNELTDGDYIYRKTS